MNDVEMVLNATSTLLEIIGDEPSEVQVTELMNAIAENAPPTVATRLERAHRRARTQMADLHRRHARLRDVHEATGELVAIRNVDVVLKAITTRARKLLSCEFVYLNTPVGASDSTFAIRSWSGDLTPLFRGIRVSEGHGVGGIVLQTGEPFQIEDYPHSTEIIHDPDFDHLMKEQGISTLLGTPLSVAGVTTGLLFAARRRTQKFTEDDIFLLSALATHAAIALQNAELHESREVALVNLSAAMNESEEKRGAAARAARLHVELSSIVLRGGQVADLLDAVRAELGIAVTYVDAAGSSTSSGEVGRLPELSALTLQDGADSSPKLRSIRVGTQRWAVVDVASSSGRLGHLVCRWSAVPDSEVSSSLERVAQAVALSLLSTQALAVADRRTADELVRKLVSAALVLTDDLVQRAHRNGIGRNGTTLVIADAADHAMVHLADNWTADRGGLAAVLDGTLTVLAPAPASAYLDELVLGLLRGERNVILGRPVHDLAGLAGEFTETRRALKLAGALGYAGARLHVEQFGIFSMLFVDPLSSDIDAFVRAHIGPLQDYDTRHSTDLAPTALALLENNMSPKFAADTLGVHPNTVNQRASRIDRLLRPDWRYQPRAFEVLAALKLSALRSNTARPRP